MGIFFTKFKEGIYIGIGMLFVIFSGALAYQYTSYVDVPDVTTGQILSKDTFNQLVANVRDLKTKSDNTGKVGSITFTRDASSASSTISYTGLGFKPRAVLILYVQQGTGQSGQVIWYNNGAGFTAGGNVQTTTWYNSPLIDIYPSGGGRQYGSVNSFDTDGFTINWTKTGSPVAATIHCTAIAFQ